MQVRHDLPLSELTTLRLGGPAKRLVEAGTPDELVEAVAAADAAGEPVLVLSGGSNLVIADEGFNGTVLRVTSRGISSSTRRGRVELEVQAGEPWDTLVSHCVAHELTGIETLSGIPGSTGAAPVQNIGAYGQEVAETIVSVRAYDRERRTLADLAGADCRFSYRSSIFRHSSRYLVLSVTLELERSSLGAPVGYAELARALNVELGARAPLPVVREAVLGLRRNKGMVIDPDDPESVSAGSFFVNPILSATGFAGLERRAASRLGESDRPPAWAEADGRVKTSAAWLIERAGFGRGYGHGHAGISRKHTLALVNRGEASTRELITLARELRDGVRTAFEVDLQPEPTLVGVEL